MHTGRHVINIPHLFNDSNHCAVSEDNLLEANLPEAIDEFIQDDENCEFTCSQKQNLKQHISALHYSGVHEQLKLFACEDCDQIFKKMNHLKVHKEAVHDGIKHYCENCTKSFSTKSHLHRHIRKNHDEKKPESISVYLVNQVL